jgi:hypothetical protein
MLREQLSPDSTIDPCLDFVFIDGSHTWEVDGFAFLLVDKLLKPGGWILFDDLYWRPHHEHGLDLPEEQRSMAQVHEVWELLALTHPLYDEMRTNGSWGWAHKATTPCPQTRMVTEVAPLVTQLREVARFCRHWTTSVTRR